MQHPRFRDGNLTTGFIAEEYPDGFDGAPADAQLMDDLAVIAGMVAVITDERAAEISGQLGPPTILAVRARGPDRGAGTRCGSSPTRAARSRCSTATGRSTSSAAGCRDSGCCSDRRRAAAHRPGPPRRPQLGAADARASHKVQVLPPHVADLSKHMIEKVPPDLSRLLLAPMPGLLTGSTSRSATRSSPASRSRSWKR